MCHMNHWLSHRLLIQIYISMAMRGGGVDLAKNSGGKKGKPQDHLFYLIFSHFWCRSLLLFRSCPSVMPSYEKKAVLRGSFRKAVWAYCNRPCKIRPFLPPGSSMGWSSKGQLFMKFRLLVSLHYQFKIINQTFLFSGLQRGWSGRRPVPPISWKIQGACLPVFFLSLPLL